MSLASCTSTFRLGFLSILLSTTACSFKGRSTSANDSPSGQQFELNSNSVDMIFGQEVSRSESWYVDGRDIYRGGNKIELKGLNWFGFDTEKLGLHGLWSGRTLDDFLNQIKDLGFNALRIPLSPQALDSNRPGSDGYQSPMAQLEDLMLLSKQRGINILFDFHNCHFDFGHFQARPDETAGACEGYGVEGWLADLKKLANVVKEYENVVGIDLFNEPYGLTWSEWKSFVNQGAKVVLETNPKILVFVEGVGGSAESAGGYGPFWGGNLFDARKEPVSVPRSRLVFSPHSYGPSVYAEHDYFNSPSFPNNMNNIWDTHFGFLADGDDAYPIAIGEFGGKYTKYSNGKDKLWQDQFVAYLVEKDIRHFFYWCLNSNSGDTNGILEDDWTTVDEDKISLLAPLLRENTND